MSRLTTLVLTILAVSLLGACSLVNLTQSGEKARVLSSQEVARCEKLGQTTATVKNSLAGVPRRNSVISEELETLARNSSTDLGGDTVVPIGRPKNGKQSFTVYKCVP